MDMARDVVTYAFLGIALGLVCQSFLDWLAYSRFVFELAL